MDRYEQVSSATLVHDVGWCWRYAAGGCGCDSLFFFSSRRRHTRFDCDWSSDVCSSDLVAVAEMVVRVFERRRRLQVQRREHLNAFALCDEPVVLGQAAPAFGGIAGDRKSVV